MKLRGTTAFIYKNLPLFLKKIEAITSIAPIAEFVFGGIKGGIIGGLVIVCIEVKIVVMSGSNHPNCVPARASMVIGTGLNMTIKSKGLSVRLL